MKKPFYKRWWFWVVVVVVVVVFCSVITRFMQPSDEELAAMLSEIEAEASVSTELQETEPEETGTVAPTGAGTTSETEEPIAEVSAPDEPVEDEGGTEPVDIKDEYDNEIVAVCKLTLDRFISGYEMSLAPQKWTIADFDEDGAIVALADVVLSSGKTERAMFVITPIFDGDKMTSATPHFISVGDTVYGDDGYCADFFSAIEEAANAFEG